MHSGKSNHQVNVLEIEGTFYPPTDSECLQAGQLGHPQNTPNLPFRLISQIGLSDSITSTNPFVHLLTLVQFGQYFLGWSLSIIFVSFSFSFSIHSGHNDSSVRHQLGQELLPLRPKGHRPVV